MLSTIAAIATGGALGAVMRHGVNVGSARLWGTDFPYGTLLVNVAGSFIMGLCIALFAHYGQPSETVRAFIVTGLLGAFTTFSNFSLDFATLWERQDYLHSTLYLSGSVLFSIGALFAAIALIKVVLP